MIRRAVAADIETIIRPRLSELPNPPFYNSNDLLQEQIESSTSVAIVDDVTGRFGLGVYSLGEQASTIIYLLPETAGMAAIAPLALEVLEGLYLIPAAQHRPLIGTFSNGFDDDGKEDKGLGKAQAWTDMVRGNGLFSTGLSIAPDRDDRGNLRGYQVAWILHELLMRFRRLVNAS